MKWFLRSLLILVVSVIVSMLNIHAESSTNLDTIFTVIGIIFSVGISLILSFSFCGATNEKFIYRYRNDLKKLLISFVVLFSICTIIYIFKDLSFEIKIKKFTYNINSLYITFFIFTIVYFITNFFKMLGLKNEIEDEISKSEKK